MSTFDNLVYIFIFVVSNENLHCLKYRCQILHLDSLNLPIMSRDSYFLKIDL